MPLQSSKRPIEFLADAKARKLNERTIYKYRFLFNQLLAFAELQGMRFLKELDTSTLRKFRTTWKDNNLAALKKLERLRSFFRLANDNGWLATWRKDPVVLLETKGTLEVHGTTDPVN